MIERIVLFKLKPEFATAGGRAEVVAHTREVFAQLPGVQSFSVGIPADERSEASWDISLIVRFASMADVPTYVDDPAHRAYVDDYISPRLEVRKAWNFDAGS